jgi:hypothetical protein
MEKIGIVSQKRVHGEVESNEGEVAEIQTVGVDGIEKDLLLETIQLHRGDTSYSCTFAIEPSQPSPRPGCADWRVWTRRRFSISGKSRKRFSWGGEKKS